MEEFSCEEAPGLTKELEVLKKGKDQPINSTGPKNSPDQRPMSTIFLSSWRRRM